MSRVSSSGSPTQWKATLSPAPFSTCRSTQLYAALILPPTNHLANGGLSQSRTWSHLVSQSRRSACFSQKASRSSSASSYASAVRLAFFANSVGRLEPALLVGQVGQGLAGLVAHRSAPRAHVSGAVGGFEPTRQDVASGRPPRGAVRTLRRPDAGLASVLDGRLGAGAGEGADLELGVALLGLRLLGGDRAQPAEEGSRRGSR